MKIMVTGSEGFICGYLVENLLDNGHEVIGIDNFSKYGEIKRSYSNNPNYTFIEGDVCDTPVMISRTGYTGELGFEIYGDPKFIKLIWDVFIDSGIMPAGLACRDLLRMEMKYCLYGNDINEETSPLEAGLNWVVSYKDFFIGVEQIRAQEEKGINKKLIPFILKDKGIPRKGYEIYNTENKIGLVTSGTFSIGLNYGIGIGYIDAKHHHENIFIDIRNKKYLAQVVKPPFIKNYSLHK